jgi:O-antigen biosynthesis protein
MKPSSYLELAAMHGIGAVDALSFGHASGWAWDPEQPDRPVEVEFLDGEQQLAVVRADRYRPDLASLGMGSGHHGFAFDLGHTVLPMSRHCVRVRRLPDGMDLAASPRVLQRESSALDAPAREHVQRLFRAEAEAARQVDELQPALTLAASSLSGLLERHVALAGEAKAPDQAFGHLLDELTPAQWVQGAGQAMSRAYPPIRLPQASSPRVSVVIPVHGKFRLTYDCVASIAGQLPEAEFEVIVVDDASLDETLLAPLVFCGSVRVLRNERNLGFVGSCNRGAEAARGEFVFFLNNDTLVRPGWLDELVRTFDDVAGVGIAGSKLLFGDGSLQEVGGIVWRLADAWNWGRHANAEEPRFCYLRDADYVSGAALMIRTGLFRELGGFDTHFAPAYYEDTDLCFRVREQGLRVVVQPLSAVVHLEGQTAGTSVAGSGMKRYQAVNHRKFLQRWKKTLRAHRFNAEQPALECERTVRKRAVFIDETVPTPDLDAGSNAALQHIRSLMRLGYKVTFIPSDNLARISPYTERLQALGVECIYHPFFWSVEEYFRKCELSIDAVYLHRFANGSKYIGLIRRLQPKARIVYNVADLHHLRLAREAELLEDEGVARQAEAVRHEELAAIRAADATIVHSAAERQLLSEDPALQGRVHVVPWTYACRPVANPPAQRHGIAFVGGYRHKPNVDAATWLVEAIMPLVWERLPELPLILVGSHMPEEVRRLESRRVRTLGYVPDVAEVYEQCLLAVAPLRYGAGVKGKVLEAFAAGVPCLMTGMAAEGVPLPPLLQGLVHDDPRGLADAIVALHLEPASIEPLAEAGLDMIARHFGAELVDRGIATALEMPR